MSAGHNVHVGALTVLEKLPGAQGAHPEPEPDTAWPGRQKAAAEASAAASSAKRIFLSLLFSDSEGGATGGLCDKAHPIFVS